MEVCCVCLEKAGQVALALRDLSAFYSICGLSQSENYSLTCKFCWRRICQCLELIEAAKKSNYWMKANPIVILLDYKPQQLYSFNITNYSYSINCNEENCDFQCTYSFKEEKLIPLDYNGYKVDEKKDEIILDSEKVEPDPLHESDSEVNGDLHDATVKEENLVIKEESCLDDMLLESSEIFNDVEIEYENHTKIANIIETKSKSKSRISKKLKLNKLNTTFKVVEKQKIKSNKVDKIHNSEEKTVTNHKRYMREKEKASSLGLIYVEYTLAEQLEEIERKKQRQRYQYAKFKCEKCGLGYQTKSVYDQHYNYKHSEAAGKHECNVCGYRFQSESLMKQHVTEVHVRKWRCGRCSEDISRQDWNQHQYKCAPEGAAHQCDVCGKNFKSKKAVYRHRAQMHGPKQAKKYECNACNKRYRMKSQLEDHMRTHTGEKPYECAPCGKKFTTMGYLRIHLDGVHGTLEPMEERYCVECDKHFKTKRLLQVHLEMTKLHANSEQYKHQCNLCDKRFIQAVRLSEHMKSVHIKSKEYTCNECGKTFSTKGPLAKHLVKKHSGVERLRNNFCPICGAAFLEKTTVRQHILAIHEKQRPHVCGICGATFGFSGAMYTHIQLKHKGVKRSRAAASTSRALPF